jgi:hypothetical protein
VNPEDAEELPKVDWVLGVQVPPSENPEDTFPPAKSPGGGGDPSCVEVVVVVWADSKMEGGLEGTGDISSTSKV